jgi:hypothetical protein
MALGKVQYTAKAQTTGDRDNGASRNGWSRSLAASVTIAAFGIVLQAAPSYAHTVRAADTQASVASPLPAKQTAAVEDDSIRPFHINVPESNSSNSVDVWRRHDGPTETVTDRAQRVQLATMKDLVR